MVEADHHHVGNIEGAPGHTGNDHQEPFAPREIERQPDGSGGHAGWVAVERRNEQQREGRGDRGEIHDHGPACRHGERPEQYQADCQSERPARDHDRHRGHDLAADKPVGHHPGNEHRHQHGSRARDDPRQPGHAERSREGHHDAARRHQGKTGQQHALAAETLTEHPTRQRDDHAGKHVKADQRAKRREID